MASQRIPVGSIIRYVPKDPFWAISSNKARQGDVTYARPCVVVGYSQGGNPLIVPMTTKIRVSEDNTKLWRPTDHVDTRTSQSKHTLLPSNDHEDGIKILYDSSYTSKRVDSGLPSYVFYGDHYEEVEEEVDVDGGARVDKDSLTDLQAKVFGRLRAKQQQQQQQ